MFPDCKFTRDHHHWRGDVANGYRTPMRWSLVVLIRGTAYMARRTTRVCKYRGLITQHSIKEGKIVEDLMLFNELMTIKQFIWSEL